MGRRPTHLHPPDAPYQWPSMRMPRHLQAAVFAGMRDMGIETDAERHAFLAEVLGAESFTEIDSDDAGALIRELRARGWHR